MVSILNFALLVCITYGQRISSRQNYLPNLWETNPIDIVHQPSHIKCKYISDVKEIPSLSSKFSCYTNVPNTTITLTVRHRGNTIVNSYCWYNGRNYYKIKSDNSAHFSNDFRCDDETWFITLKPISPNMCTFCFMILIWIFLLYNHIITHRRDGVIRMQCYQLWNCLTPYILFSYILIGLICGNGVTLFPGFVKCSIITVILLDLFNNIIISER